jgi:hypothetical protein
VGCRRCAREGRCQRPRPRQHRTPCGAGSDLDDGFRSEWGKIAERQHPFEGAAYSKGDETHVATVLGPAAAAHPALLYTVFYGVAGSRPPAVMADRLALLSANLKVTEH